MMEDIPVAAHRLNRIRRCAVILCDDAYGRIKWKQTHMGLKEFGLDYGNPDFVKYAESCGTHGHRVTSAADLLTTMQHCHEQTGVHVIEVPVDYSENNRISNHEIRELSSRIYHEERRTWAGPLEGEVSVGHDRWRLDSPLREQVDGP